MLSAGEIDPVVIAMPSDGLLINGSGYLTRPHTDDDKDWIVNEVPARARLAAPALKSDAKIAIGGVARRAGRNLFRLEKQLSHLPKLRFDCNLDDAMTL